MSTYRKICEQIEKQIIHFNNTCLSSLINRTGLYFHINKIITVDVYRSMTDYSTIIAYFRCQYYRRDKRMWHLVYHVPCIFNRGRYGDNADQKIWRKSCKSAIVETSKSRRDLTVNFVQGYIRFCIKSCLDWLPITVIERSHVNHWGGEKKCIHIVPQSIYARKNATNLTGIRTRIAGFSFQTANHYI